jgi:AbrB family looped-hinge helix DNA binding protein
MTTVDSKGRIVLPSEVREQLGLRPGSEVTVNAEGDHIILEPEDDPEQVIRDLESLIDEATANRERRQDADESESGGPSVGDDVIAAKQREIIRRGAGQDETADPDDTA